MAMSAASIRSNYEKKRACVSYAAVAGNQVGAHEISATKSAPFSRSGTDAIAQQSPERHSKSQTDS